MSFPPRPPPPIIQMGPMPPMMPNPYGYPPMGMPPMGMPPMGMNSIMQRPIGPPPNYPIVNPAVNNLRAALSQPITKVFVGNISERVPDPMIRAMLLRCGSVMSWKRVEGTSGKLQAFGFCEYDNPQSTLRCIRLLNGYHLADKKLLVKVDQKTHELLAEYIKKNIQFNKNAKKGGMKKKSGADDDDELEEKINLELADEETLKEDRMVLNALELILKQYQKDLNPPPPEPVAPPAAEPVIPPAVSTTTAVSVTANSTTVVSTTTIKPELNSTSTNSLLKPDDIHSQSTPNLTSQNTDKDRRDERSRSIEKSSREKNERDRDRDRDRGTNRLRGDSSPYKDSRTDRNDSRSNEKDAVKTSSRYYGSRSRTRSRSPVDHKRARRVSTDRGASHRDEQRAKSPSRYSRTNSDVNTTTSANNKENNQKPVVNLTTEELEEERERKKLERRLREKEQAYRDRLKEWEERESKKRRQYLVEKKAEIQRRKQLQKEAKKLRQFMEDYEDDKDDSNFYKGSNLEKRLKAREKEIEADNRDRQREKEELEELKKKLSEKGGFADVEAEARKIHEDEHFRMKNKFEKLEQSSSSSSSSSSSEDEADAELPGEKPNENDKEVSNGADAAAKTTEEEFNLKQEDTPISEDANSMQQTLNDAAVTTANSKNLMSDGDSNTSPIASNYVDSPGVCNYKSEAQLNDNFSSPNSNSPLYLTSSSRNVNTNHHYLPPSTATHVTIKSFSTNSKSKSLQPIVNKAFADEDDESNGPQFKRAKLTALNDAESKMNSEERKKAVKKLVESIPTDRDELFAYNVDWEQLDENLMEKRIKPWINKKIIEYIGEEEATLNDFICSKIQQRTNPERLLEEVKVILDDEAELFVKKMWRLIVYETESKRQGLSK